MCISISRELMTIKIINFMLKAIIFELCMLLVILLLAANNHILNAHKT